MKIVSQMVNNVLQQMTQQIRVSKPQQRFMTLLFPTLITVRGKVNFLNLSRYCSVSERTLRRQFSQPFAWPLFNRLTIAAVLSDQGPQVVAQDASFVRKSGLKTYGLDTFFNGCAGRCQKGLEVSLVSLIDVAANTAYALSVQQTPPQTPDQTRMDFYLRHLQVVRALLPETVQYGVFDGAFAKQKFVDGVCALGLHLVSKLRCDANLDYLYAGPQKKRGARRKYAGKVGFDATHLQTRWSDLGEIEPDLHLYTVVARHKSLQRVVRVLLLRCDKDPAKPRYILLFSTDVAMEGADIYRFYKARFQIEFLFRDAKQWTGLGDCQARNEKALDFHFNASVSAVNLAKVLAWQQQSLKSVHEKPVFSLASWKQRGFNEHLLHLIVDKLELEPSWVNNHANYEYLCNYGAIGP